MRISVLSILRKIVGTVVLVGLATALYAAHSKLPGFLNELSSKSKPKAVTTGQDVIVTIPKGATVSQVGGILEDEGVISSRLVFKLVSLIRGEQKNIKAGDYALKTGSDAGDVLDQLISGKTLMFSLTVPEGYDMFQVAELFEKLGVCPKDDFLNLAKDPRFLKEMGVEGQSVEGYLFPDTYFLRYAEKGDAKYIIRKMVQRFTQVYDKYVRPTADQYSWSTVQVLTLASLVEKEARASEHALVSAVFHNRLRKNMPLQSDPTVIYGIKPMGSKITRADLNRKHPYNTYQNAGLPPGPIANPGKASLVAAVQPDDVDYLYFVAKNDGTHQFSPNLKEHNHWVDLYQRQAQKESR
jgi:UPF0755 protein